MTGVFSIFTDSTKKLLVVKENQIERILVVERNQDEINRNKYIETHDLWWYC